MTAHRSLVLSPLVLCALAFTPAAAQTAQTITVKHAVANTKSEKVQPREVALKDNFARQCDGKPSCSQDTRSLLPDNSFEVEIIYECRDAASGVTRQIGPKKFAATQAIELTCL